MKSTERPKLEFNPNHSKSYGYWKLNNKIYCLGEFIPPRDYLAKDKVYCFGPKELELVKKFEHPHLSPRFLTLETLTELFSDLV
ncbi:hypothetical protein KAI32_01040 [Candidatus Pacearchaeota archaeon]|nr:hypothetical protein [Candidatus Pacearchaeota archaeon]